MSGYATTSRPPLSGSGSATAAFVPPPPKDLSDTSYESRVNASQLARSGAVGVALNNDDIQTKSVVDLLTANNVSDDANPSNAQDLNNLPVSGQTFDYLDAELAKAYGMDRNTAYAEAMANSSYQRAVADMKKAGLNPALLFGSGSGSGSGSGYVSGRSSGYGETANNAKDELFSSSMYNGLSNVVGLITALVTRNPGNYYIGTNATKGVMSLMDGVYQSTK